MVNENEVLIACRTIFKGFSQVTYEVCGEMHDATIDNRDMTALLAVSCFSQTEIIIQVYISV